MSASQVSFPFPGPTFRAEVWVSVWATPTPTPDGVEAGVETVSRGHPGPRTGQDDDSRSTRSSLSDDKYFDHGTGRVLLMMN